MQLSIETNDVNNTVQNIFERSTSTNATKTFDNVNERNQSTFS